MKLYLFFIVLVLNAICLFSQNKNGQVLYIIDSIPMYSGFNQNGRNDISDEEIHSFESSKGKEVLSKFEDYDLNEVVYITTLEFAKRPDSLKNIPTREKMFFRKGLLYKEGSSIPYSGKFIDYYINGKKRISGAIEYGNAEGLYTEYYRSGVVKKEASFKKGVQVGLEKNYFHNGVLASSIQYRGGIPDGKWQLFYPNGQLKQITNFVDGKSDGRSISYFSNGETQLVLEYKNGGIKSNKKNNKVTKLLLEGRNAFHKGDYELSIKEFDKIISLDSLNTVTYKWRGKAYAKLNLINKAKDDFDKGISIEPYDWSLYLERAFFIINTMKEADKDSICSDLEMFYNYSEHNNIEANEARKQYCITE